MISALWRVVGRRGFAVALVVALVALVAAPAAVQAYLKLGTRVGGRVIPVKWNRLPVRYFVTNRDAAGVPATQLQGALASAFRRWTSLGEVSLSAEFAGFTSADPSRGDGATVIGFQSRPDLERTLGATTFTLDDVTGEVLESDIFLNANFNWSVAAAGESSEFDVESIAVHEIGHLFGLGHSMLGETELLETGRRRVLGKRAVMFPIAYPAGNIEDRTVEPDDVAGIAEIYGTQTFAQATGSISGKVTLAGSGMFGAHVTAFNPASGATVATFALNQQGEFVISGLAPGLYIVRAEPLDDADLDSFFDTSTVVNTNFKPAYYAKLVGVPAGGAGGTIEIKVQSK